MNAHKIIEFGPGTENMHHLEMRINSSMEEIDLLLNAVEEEAQSSNPNFMKLKGLSLQLIQKLPLPVQLMQKTFLLRSRENFNGEIFKSADQLSYNPFQDKINSGRFNLAGEAVFYGALPITSHNASGQLTSMIESCKELFDSNSNFESKYFTVGKWNIIKPLKTVILTFSKVAEKVSLHLQNLNPHYLNFLISSLSQEDLGKCTRFYSLFSECAAQKNDQNDTYILTTAFLHALKDYYGNELSVLYSSSMTENTGLNIALTKELVDAEYMKFEGAVMFKAVRDRVNGELYRVFPCSNYALATEEGNFSFNYIL